MPELKPGAKIVYPDAETAVRIYLDGLIILCFNDKNICQAGVHTKIDPNLKHRMQISVLKVRNGQKESSWTLSETAGGHANVAQVAPYWLYVDDGSGAPPAQGLTDRFKENDPADERSFAHVLSFEGKKLHDKPLEFKPGVLAPLNITHGLFYSALIHEANRKVDGASGVPTPIGKITDVACADITQATGNRFIVLEQRKPQTIELFRFKLEAGVVYEISIDNAPESAHGNGHPPVNHFVEYYKALTLPHGEPKFEVSLPTVADAHPNFPPCDLTEMSHPDGLP